MAKEKSVMEKITQRAETRFNNAESVNSGEGFSIRRKVEGDNIQVNGETLKGSVCVTESVDTEQAHTQIKDVMGIDLSGAYADSQELRASKPEVYGLVSCSLANATKRLFKMARE